MGRIETRAETQAAQRQRRADHLFAVQRQLAERDAEIARLQGVAEMAQPVTRAQLEQVQSRLMARLDVIARQIALLSNQIGAAPR